MLATSFMLALIIITPIISLSEDYHRKRELKNTEFLTYDFKAKKFYGG